MFVARHAVPNLGQIRPCASYDNPYLGPDRGRTGRPTKAVRHTCPGKGIVKILRYIWSDMYTAGR